MKWRLSQITRPCSTQFKNFPPLLQDFLDDLDEEGNPHIRASIHVQPGVLSIRLQTALGMPTEAKASTLFPPPWLTHMQVHGPPPSYPSLKLPGVNAPLLPGSSWGHEKDQWGRPPTDTLHPKGKWGDVYSKWRTKNKSTKPICGGQEQEDPVHQF